MDEPSRRTWIIGSMAIILVLVAMYDLLFRFEINEFIFFLILYPTITFIIGFFSYFIFKNAWMGFATILAAGLLSMTINDMQIWLYIIIYSLIGLFGALVGKGITHLKNA